MTESVNNIYDGCQVLSPEGQLMFRCRRKKAEWYLKKKLAKIIGSEPTTIQLLFQPKGPGRIGDPFHLQKRQNLCCVCGSTDDLSRHHVVPYCYTKYDSEGFRHNSHDILPMCQICHASYEEEHSLKLRKKLAAKYHAPLLGRGVYTDAMKIARTAKAVYYHSLDMPSSKLYSFVELLIKYIGHTPTIDEVGALVDINSSDGEYKSHGELVMTKVKNINKFVRIWRRHFLQSMKPKFMPKHWDINRPIYKVDGVGNKVIYRK